MPNSEIIIFLFIILIALYAFLKNSFEKKNEFVTLVIDVECLLVTLVFEKLTFQIPREIINVSKGVTCRITAINNFVELMMEDYTYFRIPKSFIKTLKMGKLDSKYFIWIKLKIEGDCVKSGQLTFEVKKAKRRKKCSKTSQVDFALNG